MTRAQTKTGNVPEVARLLLESVFTVLRAAGWSPDDLEALKEIENKFGDTFALISKLALALDKATGEGVTSTHLQVLLPRAGDDFDPETMVDVYQEGVLPKSNRPRHRISCVSDMGLSRTNRGVTIDGGSQVEIKVILKPKVLLDTAWGMPTVATGAAT